MKFLAVSTRITPDISDYPESKKFGVFGEFTDTEGKPQTFRHIGRHDNNIDYWDGEPENS